MSPQLARQSEQGWCWALGPPPPLRRSGLWLQLQGVLAVCCGYNCTSIKTGRWHCLWWGGQSRLATRPYLWLWILRTSAEDEMTCAIAFNCRHIWGKVKKTKSSIRIHNFLCLLYTIIYQIPKIPNPKYQTLCQAAGSSTAGFFRNVCVCVCVCVNATRLIAFMPCVNL